jgi:hypothetical protein
MPPTVHTTQIKGVIHMFTKSIRSTVLAAVAFAMVPATALAIPNNGGNGEPPEPIDHAPVAKFSMSPNPALAGSQIVIQQAQARAIPADVNRFGDGDLVTFNASASTDDFGIVKYEWDLDGNGTYEVSGDSAKKTVSRRYLQTGTFHVHLRVTDAGNHHGLATHDLIVHRAPKPVLTADRTTALVGQTVNYNGAGSTDDNGIANYSWDLDGDGTFETNTGMTPTASRSYDTIGQRTVKLQVTDIYGAKNVTSLNETVHRAPTSAFTITANPAFTGDTVTFDGSTSSDDDPIAKYEWDLDGDGTFETDTQAVATAKKAYDTAGTRTIRLRVTDSHGVQDVVAHDLTVNDKPKTTTTTTTDTTAPLVTIAPRSAKLSKAGKVTLRIACPAGETACIGRLDVRSLRGARSAAIGGKKFMLAGGKSVSIKVQLSKRNQRLVKRLRKGLKAQATAVATDAAGNTGTSKARLVIHR